jgi:hypothetical protein
MESFKIGDRVRIKDEYLNRIICSTFDGGGLTFDGGGLLLNIKDFYVLNNKKNIFYVIPGEEHNYNIVLATKEKECIRNGPLLNPESGYVKYFELIKNTQLEFNF